jgi:AraC-like DNA-binding protein
MELLNIAPHDAVTELLSTLRVRSTVYCLSELREPWGFEVDGASVAKFHLVLAGECSLRVAGREPVQLEAGDLVILPRGERHAMTDRPGSPVTNLDLIVAGHPLDGDARLTYGGSGPLTRLLCGGFVLDDPAPDTLIGVLPQLLQLDSRSADITAWLEPVFALLRREAESSAPGAQAIFAKLADVFLAQALRTYLVGVEQAGLLRTRQAIDAQIAQVVAALHDRPGVDWTLTELAGQAGMSRTLFATRFRAAVGESPMRHLAKIRLGQAAWYLTTTRLSVEAIARRTGYGTNASLSKAFKREFGTSPGQYRDSRGSVVVSVNGRLALQPRLRSSSHPPHASCVSDESGRRIGSALT